jgi:hypothetical protein
LIMEGKFAPITEALQRADLEAKKEALKHWAKLTKIDHNWTKL